MGLNPAGITERTPATFSLSSWRFSYYHTLLFLLSSHVTHTATPHYHHHYPSLLTLSHYITHAITLCLALFLSRKDAGAQEIMAAFSLYYLHYHSTLLLLSPHTICAIKAHNLYRHSSSAPPVALKTPDFTFPNHLLPYPSISPPPFSHSFSVIQTTALCHLNKQPLPLKRPHLTIQATALAIQATTFQPQKSCCPLFIADNLQFKKK